MRTHGADACRTIRTFMMNNLIIRSLTIFLSSLYLFSCNNDIFVDRDGMETDNYATVDGDGGYAEFSISRKGLKRISVGDWYSGSDGPVYYNKHGDEIPSDYPASELSKIVFESKYISYSISIDHDHGRLSFTCNENLSEQEYTEIIRLEYDYTTRFINITILPGAKLNLVSVDYNDGISVTNPSETIIHTFGYNNSSSLTQTYEFYPLSYAKTLGRVVSYEWGIHDDAVMPVLFYDNEGWSLKDQMITIGEYYSANPVDWDIKKSIEIPPHSKVKIHTIITYSSASAEGTMTFENPKTGSRYSCPFNCKASSPAKYEIAVEDEN